MKRISILIGIVCIMLLTGCNSKVSNNDIENGEEDTLLSGYRQEYKINCSYLDYQSNIDFFMGDVIGQNGNMIEIFTDGKSYSNGEQCKLINKYDSFLIKDIYNEIIIKSGNKYYNYFIDDIDTKNEASNADILYIENGYFELPYSNTKANDNEFDYYMYGVKNDGIYVIYSTYSTSSDTYTITSEEKIINSDETGTIYNSSFNKNFLDSSYIYSENGIYGFKEIIENNCDLYEDVDCEFQMYKDDNSEINDILFYSYNRIIKEDGTIIYRS